MSDNCPSFHWFDTTDCPQTAADIFFTAVAIYSTAGRQLLASAPITCCFTALSQSDRRSRVTWPRLRLQHQTLSANPKNFTDWSIMSIISKECSYSFPYSSCPPSNCKCKEYAPSVFPFFLASPFQVPHKRIRFRPDKPLTALSFFFLPLFFNSFLIVLK